MPRLKLRLLRVLTISPAGVNYQNYFINVMSVAVDPLDRLWVLDNGRPLTPNGTLVDAVYGGPKLVAINTTSNTVALTVPLPISAAYPDSYLNDVRIGNGVTGKCRLE